jgi:hypothetical protein
MERTTTEETTVERVERRLSVLFVVKFCVNVPNHVLSQILAYLDVL